METKVIYLDSKLSSTSSEQSQNATNDMIKSILPIAYGIGTVILSVALYWMFGLYFVIGVGVLSIIAIAYVFKVYSEVKGIARKHISLKDIVQDLEQDCK